MDHSGYRRDNIARHSDQMLKQARQETERHKREQAAQRKQPDFEARVRAVQEARERLFDALQVGDELADFGLCGCVKKKNPKSIVTELGVRWTRDELCKL